MKRETIIKTLEKKYKPSFADKEDFIGLQLEGKNDIKKILITLDITLDVINEAIDNNIDMIISHHPLFFGEKNKFFNAKCEYLKKHKINIFIIHTNADWNEDSIALQQAKMLQCKNIEQLQNNLGVKAILPKGIFLNDLSKLIKDKLNLNYEFRTNAMPTKEYKNILIGSGASGDLLKNIEAYNSILIIGELKHHEWIFAKDNFLNVLEIGHFSEWIFKKMIKDYLNLFFDKEIKLSISKEENEYKTI